jgi:hypothetical protein
MRFPFANSDVKVVVSRKVLVAKRRVKNPSDKRVLQRPKQSTIFYLPISKDVVDALGLKEDSMVSIRIWFDSSIPASKVQIFGGE